MNSAVTHLVSLGIYTCKAVSLYSEKSNSGVLAHLASTLDADSSLRHIMETHPEAPNSLDITILQGIESPDNRRWPDLRMMSRFFMEYSPKSLRIDVNVQGTPLRAVALDLRTGVLHETSHDDAILHSSTWSKSRGQRIRTVH